MIRHHGQEADPVDISESLDGVPDGYDGVIVGASIHMGKHDKRVVEFVEKNRDALERLPSAFFSVSLAAHGDTEEAEGYVEQLEEERAWRAGRVGLFGGAFLYTHSGFVKRHMMKRIARDKPGNLGTDTLTRLRLHRLGWRDEVHRGLLGLPHRRSGHDQRLAHRRGQLPPIRQERMAIDGAQPVARAYVRLVSQEPLQHGVPWRRAQIWPTVVSPRPSAACGWP